MGRCPGYRRLVEESQAVVDEIAQDSRSMDRHCDQLRETVRELEAEGGVLSIADYNVLLRDTNEIPAIIEDMRECLGQVQRRSEETYVRYLQYSAFYADSRGQFDAIAGVSGIVSRYVEAAADAQVRFERLLVMADGFLSDMWGLVSWYRNFHSSYDGLIVEVQRRRHVQKEMHAVVEDMRSRLEAMYMERCVRGRGSLIGPGCTCPATCVRLSRTRQLCLLLRRMGLLSDLHRCSLMKPGRN
ncbi:autophagy protein Apg17-domain-containing protein [Kickxella alabastrina]|uniref:autophagy protein Apg17-domain-containing protein n=1 Tax=Kickxella alabastrina TaxID=61397 RepID=UPI00221FD47E|nr:autophagy protein Apg17-domain-containing protein [Kickxella alabastrina]KAI7830868.1 autophagy protein Apg17-domain-containing protein [Kickxella alabastrina]